MAVKQVPAQGLNTNKSVFLNLRSTQRSKLIGFCSGRNLRGLDDEFCGVSNAALECPARATFFVIFVFVAKLESNGGAKV